MLPRGSFARIGLLMLLIWMFAISGCGAPQTPAPSPAPPPAPEGPQRGGTFYWGRIEDTETLDPHRTTTVSSNEVNMLIYDRLVALDYDMSIQPALAHSWDVSPDGKTYTFHLKKGVRFHSGDELTAHDVKFTMDRWKNLEGSPSRYLIALLEEVTVIDDYSVEMRLSDPFAIFLDNLAGAYGSILNERFFKEAGEDYGIRLVDGTGPFKFVKWTRMDTLELERNDEYTWGPAVNQNQGPAYLDRVVLKVIPEDGTRIAELESGGIHYTANIPQVEVDRLDASSLVNIVRYSDLNTTFVGFRLDYPKLMDVRVRQAINHAINKEEIVEGAFYGMAEVAQGPLAPKTWGWWEDVPKATYGYDPQKANKLLDEAGWKTGADGIREKDGEKLKLVLAYSVGTATDVMMPMIQAHLREVGIEAELRLMEWTAYLEFLRAGQNQLWLMSVRYSNADNLYFYFHSAQRPAPNRFAWVDERTDELLVKSRTSTSEQERLAAYAELQKIVIENALQIPLVHVGRAVGHAPSVHGLRIHPTYVQSNLLDVYLEP